MKQDLLKCPWCGKEYSRFKIISHLKRHCSKAPKEICNMESEKIFDTYFSDFQKLLVKCPWCSYRCLQMGIMNHIKCYCKKAPLGVLKMSFDEIFQQGLYHPDKLEGKDYIFCLVCRKEGKEKRIKSLAHHLQSHKLTLEDYKIEFPEQEKFRADVYNESVKQTWVENYGVDNPSKSAEIQEKREQTILKNHGVKHPSQNPEIAKKIKDSHAARTPEEKEETQIKFRQTTQEHHGVDHPSHSPEILKKIVDSNANRTPEEKAASTQKTIATNQERYGTDYSSQNPEISKKIKDSHAKRTPEEKEETERKKIETNQEHHGVDHPFQSSEIRAKSKETIREVYGVEHPSQNLEVAKKILDSHAKRTPEEKEETERKKIETNQELYGVDNGAQSKESKEKLRCTNQERYGVDSTAQIPAVRAQISESLVKNHALKTPEEKQTQIQKRKETLNLKSEIFAYIGRNGDTRYLHTINVPESKFNDASPDNIAYTGDKVFYISTPDHPGYKSANPDFLVMPIKETKKVIEIFGVYIHSTRPGIPREEAESEKITQYAQVGYQCLIIWDDELLKDQEHLNHQIQRAKDFCGIYWDRPFEKDLSFFKGLEVKRAKHKQILSENIVRLLARTESTEELEKKKIKMCQEVIKDQDLDIKT